ncbi:hypothetical protein [Rhodophyticola porphyridii]|uniref:hypothetical protein n=1 Tax=Rhodophyticola porphyridii TaxID=1852017 RepID=UPI0018F58DAF|nr:hypothetical protein [Rhodophyticola porphyridii]
MRDRLTLDHLAGGRCCGIIRSITDMFLTTRRMQKIASGVNVFVMDFLGKIPYDWGNAAQDGTRGR